MPKDSVCCVPPQSMSNDYFAESLAGKRMNIVNEMPQGEVVASEKFKNVVSGELTSGRPIGKRPVQYRPTAGHLFSANRLPSVTDQSTGFWRRVAVIRFSRTIPADERIRDLGHLMAKQEGAAIVSWFIRGAVSLLERGEYVLPPSHHAAVEAWRQRADIVREWLSECTEPTTDTEAMISKERAWGAFGSWVAESNFKGSPNRSTFYERMAGAGHQAKRRALGKSGKQTADQRYPLSLVGVNHRHLSLVG
jgi:putative DNA primase/helicase